MKNELYVVTLVYCNSSGEESRMEKRFTDADNLEKCIESAKRSAEERLRLFDDRVSIHLNKAYMCFDGYLYTGDYVKQVM